MSHRFPLAICLIFVSIGLGLSPAKPLNSVSARGAQRRPRALATANAPSSGGIFYVNSNYDYTTANGELSLREAILLANGGTGSTGLNRGLTPGEENQTVGCSFDGSGHITGGCGPGEPNSIVFDSSLGVTPTITLKNGGLPPISNTQPTIISGWGASVAIDGNATAMEPFQVSSNANQIEYLTVKNFTGDGILIGSDDNTIYAVSAIDSVTGNGITIIGNGNTVNYSTLVSNHADGIDIRGINNKLGGSVVRQNGMVGVRVYGSESRNNVIGGPSFANPLTGNIISANATGVELGGGGYSILAGNKIGTTADGLSADGNTYRGVEVGSDNNVIGDPLAAPNIISGNGEDGVYIADSRNNQVADNLIGVSSSLGALPNDYNGVLIGGIYGSMTTTVSANVIAYSGKDGVAISAGQGNLIQNNTIEFNQQHGVWMLGGPNVVNTRLTGGSIHDNGLDGIYEFDHSASSNSWSQISTYDNGGLGIFTQAGSAPPHPTITSATTNGIQWTIAGTATASFKFNPVAVEVYLAAPDPTGFGEGQTYLGTVSVNNVGTWSFQTPDQNFGCYTAFETETSIILATAASSDFSQNLCRVRLFLPLIRRS